MKSVKMNELKNHIVGVLALPVLADRNIAPFIWC
jgi:hypothetical protein